MLRVALRSTVLKRGAAMLTVARRLSTAREAHRWSYLILAASLKMARRRTSSHAADASRRCWNWKRRVGTGVRRTKFINVTYGESCDSLVGYAAKPFHRCDVDRRECIRRIMRYAVVKLV